MGNEELLKNVMIRRYKYQIQDGISIFLFSIFSIFLTELFYFKLSGAETWYWLLSHWQLFLGASVIITVFILLLYSLTNRLILSIAVPFFITVLLGIVNALKMHYRGAPLYPDELLLVANVGDMSRMVTIGQFYMISVILALFLLCLIFAVKVTPRYQMQTTNRIIMGSACLFIAVLVFTYNHSFVTIRKVTVGILLLILVVTFLLLIKPGFYRERRSIMIKGVLYSVVLMASLMLYRTGTNPVQKFVSVFSPYAQGSFDGSHYDTNGVVLAFIKEVNSGSKMERPGNYGEAAVVSLVEKYKDKAAVMNIDRSGSDVRPNIVYIMSEAFSDPTVFGEFTYSVDPIPYIRSLQNQLPSGLALVPVFGGGTIYTEYEALTGFSSMNMLSGDLFGTVGKHPGFPSIVSFLKGQGYGTTAVHPNSRNFYRRNLGYASLGFDEFLDKDTMGYTDTADGYWITDTSAFLQVLDVLDKSEEPQFVHLVTMQNHGPYFQDAYSNMQIGVEGELTEEVGKSLSIYAKGINLSDIALENFLYHLQLQEKPTLVVFWGDHRPVGYASNFFTEKGYVREQYETPFFYHATFPLENQDFGTISPIYFQSILYNLLGFEVSPFQAFMDDLYAEVNGLSGEWYIDSNNEKRDLVDMDAGAAELLELYRLIRYDVLCGSRMLEQQDFFEINFTRQ